MNNAELLFTLTRFGKGLIKMQCWATLNNAVQRIYSEIKLLAQIEFEMSTERIVTPSRRTAVGTAWQLKTAYYEFTHSNYHKKPLRLVPHCRGGPPPTWICN